MPTRDVAPAGAPTWIELFTNDAPAARSFYADLFGWEPQVNEEFGGYTTFHLDGNAVAGCMGNDDPAHPADFWSVYLNVADAAATAEAAVAAGGQLLLAPMPVGDLGHMAMLVDPAGAPVGLWQPVEFVGTQVLAEPGAPAWFELHTQGYDAARAWYASVFGWELTVMSDDPTFRYSTLGEGETALAGIMDDAVHGIEGPSYWTTYINVADADATVAKASELGGGVMMAPEDTPYGRLAVLTDTTGSRFSIMQ